MRNATSLVLGLVFAGCALGQLTPPRTYGSPSGFGSILFPGVGTPPPLTSPTPVYAGRAHGRAIYGLGGGAPVRPLHGGGGRTIVVPYAYPIVVGGGYYGTDAPPAEAYYYPQQGAAPAPQAPAVVINQTFIPESAQPRVTEYGEELPPPARMQPRNNEGAARNDSAGGAGVEEPPKPTVYLIAFRDHSIYSAIAYWVEDDTLNYVTPYGVHNSASLDLVDEELSRRINGDRNIDFRLKRQAAPATPATAVK